MAGAGGFALLAVGEPAPFVAGALVAFTLGWGWPGLFNLAVVDLHREAPGAATGISQTGIYVGAAAGPAATGCCRPSSGIPRPGAWSRAPRCWPPRRWRWPHGRIAVPGARVPPDPR